MTLTKAHITESIYHQCGFSKSKSIRLIETLLEIMKTRLESGEEVLISGFGKLEAYDKKARKGRNPQTDETITLPPRKVVVFRLSRKFRAELNG